MPRVVPSRVVKYIASLFPGNLENGFKGISISNQSNPGLEALCSVVEEIPDELLLLNAQDYMDIRAGVAAIRERIRGPRGSLDPLPGIGRNPVAMIYDALSRCPDAAASEDTSGFSFIGDSGLETNLRLDMSSANRAFAEGEWKAATVLAGSVAEALLLWKLQSFGVQDIKQAICDNANVGKLPADDLVDRAWSLFHYAEIAAQLGVISDRTKPMVDLARGFRNLIHPGYGIRLGEECGPDTAHAALGAVERLIRDFS